MFVHILAEIHVFFQITSLSIEYRLKLKFSDQILTMKSEFVSFDLLQVGNRSFSNNWHVCAPANKNDLTYGNTHYHIFKTLFAVITQSLQMR